MKKIIAIFVLMFLTSCGSASTSEINLSKGNERKIVTIQVTDKGIKTCGQNCDKYLIYTTKGTYEITDSLLNLQYNSSDIYGYIQVGKCYDIGIDAFSFRSGFLSSYENITSATEIICK